MLAISGEGERKAGASSSFLRMTGQKDTTKETALEEHPRKSLRRKGASEHDIPQLPGVGNVVPCSAVARRLCLSLPFSFCLHSLRKRDTTPTRSP